MRLNAKTSFVIPMYNESEGVHMFHYDVLFPEIKKTIGKNYEIVYVNDGSKDNTLELLLELAKKDNHIKVVNLSRNFGKEIATTAGIYSATGDIIIIMDGDGQHPPAYVNEFIKKWQDGAQVVIGVRDANHNEGYLKKWGSKVFYSLFNSTSGAEIVPRSTDFRLITRDVQQEFIKFTERQRITRGLIDWLGFKRDYVHFTSPARLAGEASYKTSQLIRLALNSFVSLSLKPLFFFGWMGVLITGISLIVGIFIFIEQFIINDPLNLNFTGSALLGIFISFLVGIVLTSQGIMAVYMSHIHAQTQARPLFVIDKKHSANLDNNDK